MSAKVRVSPISRMAAILIIGVGAFVLFAAIITGELASYITGIAFIVLGVALYLILIRFTRKLARDIGQLEQDQAAGP
ncbi:MAG TPA: hypothetical protein VEH01_01050 [Nitrososphaerales archaeon]|nr:hypothetical protein [Nitrososphaerales archaeon]